MAQQGAQGLYLDVKASGACAKNRTCVIISPLNQKPGRWINEILAAVSPAQGAKRSKARVQKAFVV